MYNYSIIIPHYNIPKLLRRCLDSIPKRDDVQVIVVDDNSSDEHREVLESYMRIYSNVEFYFLSNNRGGGHARNVGLSHAQGKYLIFADADDGFNYCFNEALDRYKDTNFDIVFFNASCLDTESYCNVSKRKPMVNSIFDLYPKKKSKSIFQFKYIAGEPWAKFVNKKLVELNNIIFQETKIHNDTYFGYMTGFLSKNIEVDNHAIYCLYDRDASVSKTISDDRLLTRVDVFSSKYNFLKKHGIDCFEDSFICGSIFHSIKRNKLYLIKPIMGICKANGISSVFLIVRCIFYFIKYLFNK